MSLPRDVTGASFAAWDGLCCYQLEVKKKCPQAGLTFTVAAGMWVREHKCIPVLGPAEATPAVSCGGQMVLSLMMTSEMRLELGVSREPGKQKPEKTVWVIPASSLSSVLIFPV